MRSPAYALCVMSCRWLAIVASLAVLSLSTGCGVRGPLTLPKVPSAPQVPNAPKPPLPQLPASADGASPSASEQSR